jgi:hypothetical protein
MTKDLLCNSSVTLFCQDSAKGLRSLVAAVSDRRYKTKNGRDTPALQQNRKPIMIDQFAFLTYRRESNKKWMSSQLLNRSDSTL